MTKRILLLSASLLFVFAACETDSGSGGSATKLGECKRMYAGYCAKYDALCADKPAGHCVSAANQACEANFDGSCGASSQVVQSVDHELDMIVNPKGTCAALQSIDTHVWDTIADWSTIACEGGGSGNTSGTDVSALCENVAAATCQKIIDIGCIQGSLTECEQTFLNGESLALGTTMCSLSMEQRDATAAEQAAYDEWMSGVSSATSCADFGF